MWVFIEHLIADVFNNSFFLKPVCDPLENSVHKNRRNIMLPVLELNFLDEEYLMWVLNTENASGFHLIFPFILRKWWVFEIKQVNICVYYVYLYWHILCFSHLKFLALTELQGNIFYVTIVCLMCIKMQGSVLNNPGPSIIFQGSGQYSSQVSQVVCYSSKTMVHIKDTLPSEREAAALSSALKEIWQEVLFSLGKSFGFTKKLHSLRTTHVMKWLWTSLEKKGKPGKGNWNFIFLLQMSGRANFKIGAEMVFRYIRIVSQQIF